MSEKAPLVQVIQAAVPATATAGDAAAFVIGKAPFAGVVTAASYITPAAITGNATNNRTFSVVNTGAAGDGTTSVAAVTTNASNSFVAYDEKALTLSATAAHRVLAAGDVLKFNSAVAASGVADPGGVVTITLSAV